MSRRDPKGYYIALEIGIDADAAMIKSAFRVKAKRLHPDFNPSPIAAKQFHRLHEAYATLSDPRKRAAYDRPWKDSVSDATKRAESADAKPRDSDPPPQSAEQRPPEPRPAEQRTAQNQRAEPQAAEPPRRVPPDAPVICQCGQITAQPRYVLFDMVWGRVRRVHRRTLGGVYCRTCADKTALRSSMVSWVAGWWAWPDGPRETIRAILNNARGGRMPADRNARLLMRQARAFKGRGDLDLARNAALQARSFARTADVRRDVETLIASLGPPSGRVLKDRWGSTGWAPMLQMMPLALMGAIAAMVATFYLRSPDAPLTASGPPVPIETVISKPAPRVFKVVSEGAPLRTGPNDIFEVIVTLMRGERVTSLETDPSGAWMRVMLGDGRVGFIAAPYLEPVS